MNSTLFLCRIQSWTKTVNQKAEHSDLFNGEELSHVVWSTTMSWFKDNKKHLKINLMNYREPVERFQYGGNMCAQVSFVQNPAVMF